MVNQSRNSLETHSKQDSERSNQPVLNQPVLNQSVVRTSKQSAQSTFDHSTKEGHEDMATPKSKKARTRSKLNGRIRIFAILWCVLVAITLVCLLFLFVSVMNSNQASEEGFLKRMNGEKGKVKDYVEEYLLHHKNAQHKDGKAMNEAEENKVLTNVRPEDAVTVAFAVSVTGCGSDPLTEGAAVLKHSIHRASVRGDMGGRYNYKMYAIYHPQAITCAKTLEALGFELLERETFVKVEDIKGDFLRKNIEKNGCCGEKEFIKLEAYTLVQHPIVVHLDLDVLVLRPLDTLFDVMMQSETKGKDDPLDLSNLVPQFPSQPAPTEINAFFTRDCKCHVAKAWTVWYALH